MAKRKNDWTAERGADPRGRAGPASTSTKGVWMPYYDKLPKAVRQRLASERLQYLSGLLEIEVRAQVAAFRRRLLRRDRAD
jgi:hypothetical protein